MSLEITIDENILIAKFMGYKFNDYPDLRHSNITKPNESSWFYASWDIEDFNSYVLENLNFHSSWGLLMPVIEKIAKIDITPAPNYTGYRIEIVPSGYIKIEGTGMPRIFKNVSVEKGLINATCAAIVEFIKFYNH